MNNFNGLSQYLITLANSINTLANRVKALEKNTQTSENQSIEHNFVDKLELDNLVNKVEEVSKDLTNQVKIVEKKSETLSNKVSILDEKFTKLEKDLENFVSNLNVLPTSNSSTEDEITNQLNMSVDEETIPIGDDIIIGIKEEKKQTPKKKSTKRL